jgi:hypothetical protein
MAAFNPQVGDIGLEIIVDFETCDCEGNVIPLPLDPVGTVITICLRKPDQSTTVEFSAGFSSCGLGDGTDGSASFVTSAATDLDVAGVWQVSGKVTYLDGRIFRGNSKNMTVETPVCS